VLLDPEIELAGRPLIGEEKLARKSLLGFGSVDKFAAMLCGQVDERIEGGSERFIKISQLDCTSAYPLLNTYVSSSLS